METTTTISTTKDVKPYPKSLRTFAKIISYIFHPVLMPTLMMLVLYRLSPVSFAGITNFGLLVIQIAVATLLFPVVSTLLIKAVGFIESIHMENPKDRIIPLIASMTFYFWINHVMDNLHAPLIVHTLTLGAFWGIIAIFMINIFFKISMHTVAAGGVLGIMLVLTVISPVNLVPAFFVTLFIAGLVGTARLILGAHHRNEVWLGYIVGVLVQVGAYWYLS